MNAFERMIEDDDDGRQETVRHQHGETWSGPAALSTSHSNLKVIS